MSRSRPLSRDSWPRWRHSTVRVHRPVVAGYFHPWSKVEGGTRKRYEAQAVRTRLGPDGDRRASCHRAPRANRAKLVKRIIFVAEAFQPGRDQPITWILRFRTNALCSGSRYGHLEGDAEPTGRCSGTPDQGLSANSPRPLRRLKSMETPTYCCTDVGRPTIIQTADLRTWLQRRREAWKGTVRHVVLEPVGENLRRQR